VAVGEAAKALGLDEAATLAGETACVERAWSGWRITLAGLCRPAPVYRRVKIHNRFLCFDSAAACERAGWTHDAATGMLVVKAAPPTAEPFDGSSTVLLLACDKTDLLQPNVRRVLLNLNLQICPTLLSSQACSS